MDAPETPVQGPSSKEMLGYLITLASGVFAGLQIIVFLFFRWQRVNFTNLFGGQGYHWTLNPWVILLPVGIVFMGTVWWRVCRKLATRRQQWLLAGSLFLSIGILVLGLCMHPPASYIPSHEPLVPAWDPHLLNHPLLRSR